MVKVKQMNEEFFSKLQKDLTVVGELIRARQEEKQKLINAFDAEGKRFFFGKISQKAWQSSVKKTNLELQRLDKQVREAIKRVSVLCDRTIKFCSNQAPIGYRATMTGIVGGAKKKTIKKKPSKKKKKSSKKKK